MFRETIAKVARATPFRPFTVRTRDGAALRVGHPEVISFPAGRGDMIAIAKPAGGVRIISTMLIESVEHDLVPTPDSPQRR